MCLTTIEYRTIIKTVSITYLLMCSEVHDHKIGTMSKPLSFTLRRQTFDHTSCLLHQNDGNYTIFVYLMKMLIFLINKKKTLGNVIHLCAYTHIRSRSRPFRLFACFSPLFPFFFFFVSTFDCSK
jgi:hypothetical protein